ncbi:Rap1a/Tai family immunity protein [Pseudomonas kuykendallii]|uniref:Rap1a/Tai family immunity protein n=1 Tax=Pseudomonas kuykendallii TaxID=1007099 RepID=UPI003C6E0BCF
MADLGIKAACLAIVFIVSPVGAVDLPKGVLDAHWLVTNCGAVAKWKASNISVGMAAEAGSCVGYLGGLAETSQIMNSALPAKARACIQHEVRSDELAKVVLDYIKRRPAVIGDPRLVVSLAALAERYPCR